MAPFDAINHDLLLIFDMNSPKWNMFLMHLTRIFLFILQFSFVFIFFPIISGQTKPFSSLSLINLKFSFIYLWDCISIYPRLTPKKYPNLENLWKIQDSFSRSYLPNNLITMSCNNSKDRYYIQISLFLSFLGCLADLAIKHPMQIKQMHQNYLKVSSSLKYCL